MTHRPDDTCRHEGFSHTKNLACPSDAQAERIAELESLVTALRNELSRDMQASGESKLATATETASVATREMSRCHRLWQEDKARLYAANALLRARRHDAIDDYEVWNSEVDAFLAGQPAAPAYRCGSCRDTGKWSNGIECPACGGASVKPAAPYGTPDESPGFNAAWPLGAPKPAAPTRPDFVGDAIRSACSKLGMSEAVADKLSAPTRTEAEPLPLWSGRGVCPHCRQPHERTAYCRHRAEAERRVLDVVRGFMANSPTWVQANLPTLYAAARGLK